MEKTINKVELNGFIGFEPEIKIFEHGNKLVRLSVGTHENHKNREGEWIRETTWHKVVIRNGKANEAAELLKRGTRVSLMGKLVNRSFTDSNGNKRMLTEIHAFSIEPISEE